MENKNYKGIMIPFLANIKNNELISLTGENTIKKLNNKIKKYTIKNQNLLHVYEGYITVNDKKYNSIIFEYYKEKKTYFQQFKLINNKFIKTGSVNVMMRQLY
jgi:hypothetical protein